MQPSTPDPYGQQPTEPAPGQRPPGVPPQGLSPQSHTPYPRPQPAGYATPPPSERGNLFGTLALAFGIIGIPLAFCLPVIDFLGGGAAIVLGVIGLRKAAAGQATNRGMALAGLICGVIGIMLAIGSWLLVLLL